MTIIGIIVLGLSLLVLVLAWHGRVIARGQFCRKCKFDLAGLDLESFGSKCPECGCEVHNETARRTLLRKKSYGGLAVSGVLLCVGLGSLGLSAAGQTRAIVAVMPDSVVLFLTDLGVNEAFDELHTRTSRIPSTISAKNWDRAIEAGLAFQADTTRVWDMRWGQVLFDALNFNQMSDAELEKYITAGIQFDLVVRDRVHPYTVQFRNRLYRSQTRMEPISGGPTELILLNQITAFGIVGHPPIQETELYVHDYYLDIYNDGRKSSASIGMNNPLDKKPGDQIDIFFEYQVQLKHFNSNEPLIDRTFREEFTISVIDPQEPLVAVVKDDALSQHLFESIHMMPIRVTEQFDSEGPINVMTSSSIIMVNDGLPFPYATRIFLVFDDLEVQVGTMIHASYDQSGIGGLIMLKPNSRYGLTSELLKEVHARLRELEAVTVELRTDPALLLDIPEINQTLGINITFEDVPIEILPNDAQYPSYDLNEIVKPTHIKSYGETP